LMPNTARGGGISRKITDSMDRKRLKEIAQELEVPEGMGVILRTAGASRTKTEVKRDFEYLLRLWETVRDLTLKSTAPTLVYEEGSLVKRSIRDLYNKDIDEVLVAGEEAFREAKDFMRMLMPSHAKNVKLYADGLPIFSRFGIESQLDAMFQPVVQLRSGGYIVINQAEALVAIDVNSGRATREHHIEDTALKTNVEASEEVARQLRLRDLAGLIVIDFIDMDEKRNNRTVERRLKEALKHDRARIQVGHISHFGLLEMSRQRIRSSVLESSTEKCPNCGGTGHIRSVSSVSLQLLRGIEEMLLKGATHNLIVRTRTEIALYLLNHKRAHLRDLEQRFQLTITVNADATVVGQISYAIEKGEQVHSIEQAKALAAAQPVSVAPLIDPEDDEAIEESEDDERETSEAHDVSEPGELTEVGETHEGAEDAEAAAAEGERNGTGRKRRRRRRGRRGEGRDDETAVNGNGAEHAAGQDTVGAHVGDAADHADPAAAPGEAVADMGAADLPGETAAEGERRRRRRGRRGGRRNRQGQEREGEASLQPEHAAPAFNGESGEPEPHAATPAESSFAPHDHEPETHHEPASHREATSHHEPASHDEPEATRAEPNFRAPAAETAVSPQADLSDPPRRGSTVREPAPMRFGGDLAAPSVPLPSAAPQPVVSITSESDDSARPRRSGWWSKRVAGKE
jgi:ribonuclease E